MANTCYHADKICSELTSLGPQFALLVHYSVNQIMTSPTVVWFIYFLFVCMKVQINQLNSRHIGGHPEMT